MMPDFLTGTSTPPGRPRKFLLEPESKRLPFSCTLMVHRDVAETMAFTARSLKAAAGVKTIYDKDFQLDTVLQLGSLQLLCGANHADFTAFDKVVGDFQKPTAGNALPVLVQDSMETILPEFGVGIIDSWRQVWEALSTGQSVVVDLTQLRPAGILGSGGIEASGPASFAEIYIAMYEYAADVSVQKLLELMGTLNEVILRGGFKRGIVTSMMDVRCPLFADYMTVPIASLRGSHKKGAIMHVPTVEADEALQQLIVDKIASEGIFLEKATDDGTYSNVCVGIKLKDRGTCLIWRVNLGRCATRSDVIEAFRQTMLNLCQLHVTWRDHPNAAQNRDVWAPLHDDRQVALDVMGLANMLAGFGYKYKSFVEDLEAFVENPTIAEDTEASDEQLNVIEWLYAGYCAAKTEAERFMFVRNLPELDRLFTVEPAQAHSFETTDIVGFTTCRGIWPPMSRITNRVSETEADVLADYGNVETVAEVTPELVFRLNVAWQKLMNLTGKAHTISADTYEKPTVKWLQKFLASDLQTIYYNFSRSHRQDYASKVATEFDWGEPEEPVCSVCAQ